MTRAHDCFTFSKLYNIQLQTIAYWRNIWYDLWFLKYFFCALCHKTSQQCSLFTSRTSFTPLTFSIFVIPASFFGNSLCSICSVHICFRSYAIIRSSTMHPLREPGPPVHSTTNTGSFMSLHATFICGDQCSDRYAWKPQDTTGHYRKTERHINDHCRIILHTRNQDSTFQYFNKFKWTSLDKAKNDSWSFTVCKKTTTFAQLAPTQRKLERFIHIDVLFIRRCVFFLSVIVYLFPVGLVSRGVNIVAERLDGSRCCLEKF